MSANKGGNGMGHVGKLQSRIAGFLRFICLGFYKPLPSISALFFCKCLYFVDYNARGFFQTLWVTFSHPCAFKKPLWEVLQRQSQYKRRVLTEFRRDCIIGFSLKVKAKRMHQGQFNYLIGFPIGATTSSFLELARFILWAKSGEVSVVSARCKNYGLVWPATIPGLCEGHPLAAHLPHHAVGRWRG